MDEKTRDLCNRPTDGVSRLRLCGTEDIYELTYIRKDGVLRKERLGGMLNYYHRKAA